MQVDGLIDTAMMIVSRTQVMGSHPAANAPVLEILIQTAGQRFVGVSITEEQGMVLKRHGKQGGKIVNKGVWETYPPKKMYTCIPLGECDRFDINA